MATAGPGSAAARAEEPVAGGPFASAYPDILKFAVTRDGSPLGVVMERFRRDGRDGVTEVYIEFAVSFAMFTLYRYEHRSRERWRGGRLAALDTVTNDNGTAQAVAARAGAGGLHVEGMEGRLVAPTDILPSSYWHPRFVDQTRMLDSQLGRLLDFEIRPVGSETVPVMGRPVTCIRYAMRGDVDLDIWYDPRRVWQKMAFAYKGSVIEYRRVAPGPGDVALFGAPLRDGRSLPSA